MCGLKTIKRFFGGAFNGRLVDEFHAHHDVVDGFEISDFEENKISHYAGPTEIRKDEALKARYVLIRFRIGQQSCRAWVYDPKECKAISENARGGISDKFYVFLVECIGEEKKDF